MKLINAIRSDHFRKWPIKTMRIMKLTILIMTTFFLQVSANSLAQKVTLKQKNITLKQVFNQIRSQTGYDVLWQSGKVNEEKRIDVNFVKEELSKVLDEIFTNQDLSYSIVDKTVVIKPMKSSKVTPLVVKSVQQRVNGTVTDSLGITLPGASVLIKGSNVGTQTDKNGNFSFPNLDENTVLVVSFTGFITREIPVRGKSEITVVLKESASELGEVVVVVFGTQKKTDMVGSVTTIKPSDLRIPSSKLTNALAGQAAGIIAYQRSGEPGQDNADFFIRGVTSFGTGKVDPLILIDGVELGVTE